MRKDKLNLLIKQGQQFSPVYKINGKITVSNHLPMCLYARYKLGASTDELQHFFDNYIKKLEPKKSNSNPFDWKESLGTYSHNSEYIAFFKLKLQELGKANLLKEFLPLLFKGVGAGAFHPLIRLGFALEMDNEDEIVESLAAWAMSFLPLKSNEKKTNETIPEILTRLSNDLFDANTYRVPTVYKRMVKANQDPFFQEHLRIPTPIDLKTISQAALKIFRSHPSFACIHLVTSTHALRLVLPYLEKPQVAFESFWLAFISVYVSEGAPKINLLQNNQPQSWNTLSSKATSSNNDHWCKIVYTCCEEEKFYGSEDYLKAAHLLLFQ